ncbi:MAG TPA: dienelactone hydrolase family protein [Acidimicrobiales bacterium]|nr:dienelactone hydrolase family protein [Acidimicrobiales bacterium]
MALREYLVGEVAEDFADGLVGRREALRRLGLLGLGAAGAAALLAACGGGGDADTAATTAAGSASTSSPSSSGAASTGGGEAEPVRFAGPSGELQGAYAAPAGPKAAVLVIHENRGLTAHFLDVVGRLAGEGYAALCVDLLSAEGGTASLADPAAAPAALAAAPAERLLADLRAGLDELGRRAPGVEMGAVGFCFGGAMAWRLVHAGEPRLAAVVPFYGPAPDDADFSRSRAAVLGIYAGLDTRVNASRERAAAALERAGLVHEIRTFEGAEHAFFNDTGPRYHADAAGRAWAALLAWFGRHLA